MKNLLLTLYRAGFAQGAARHFCSSTLPGCPPALRLGRTAIAGGTLQPQREAQ